MGLFRHKNTRVFGLEGILRDLFVVKILFVRQFSIFETNQFMDKTLKKQHNNIYALISSLAK